MTISNPSLPPATETIAVRKGAPARMSQAQFDVLRRQSRQSERCKEAIHRVLVQGLPSLHVAKSLGFSRQYLSQALAVFQRGNVPLLSAEAFDDLNPPRLHAKWLQPDALTRQASTREAARLMFVEGYSRREAEAATGAPPTVLASMLRRIRFRAVDCHTPPTSEELDALRDSPIVRVIQPKLLERARMVFIEGHSMADVAKSLNLKVDSVRDGLTTILMQLRMYRTHAAQPKSQAYVRAMNRALERAPLPLAQLALVREFLVPTGPQEPFSALCARSGVNEYQARQAVKSVVNAMGPAPLGRRIS